MVLATLRGADSDFVLTFISTVGVFFCFFSTSFFRCSASDQTLLLLLRICKITDKALRHLPYLSLSFTVNDYYLCPTSVASTEVARKSFKCSD